MTPASAFRRITSTVICLQFIAGSMPVLSYAAARQDHLRPRAAADGGSERKIEKELKARDGGSTLVTDAIRQDTRWEALGQGAVVGSMAWFEAAGRGSHRLVCEVIEDIMARDPVTKLRVRPVPTAKEWLEKMKRAAIIANVMNGGKHAGWATNIQEWMLAVGLGKEMLPSERIALIQKVVKALSDIFNDPAELTKALGRPITEKFPTTVGDEGGFAPALKGDEEAIKLIKYAIKKAHAEELVGTAIDCAASELFDEKTGLYTMMTPDHTVYDPLGWARYLKNLMDRYGIQSNEDPFSEHDKKGWTEGVKILGDKAYIVGDDLTTTKINSLKEAFANGSIDTVLIKVNQNGSISGTLEVIQYALLNGINVFISHRSGETSSAFITHLLFAATMMEQKPNKITGKMPIIAFKAGGFRRSDRMEKYNEELLIETHFTRIAAGLGAKINQPGLTPSTIVDMYWLELYDSRGNKVLGAVTTTNDGNVSIAKGQAGASTGSTEAVVLTDKKAAQDGVLTKEFLQTAYPGRDITQAIERMRDSDDLKFNVHLMNKYVAPRFIGTDPLKEVVTFADLKESEVNKLYDVNLKLAKAHLVSQKIHDADATAYSVTSNSFESFNGSIAGKLSDAAFVISAEAIFNAPGSRHAIIDLKHNNPYTKVYAWARNADEEAKLVAMHLDLVVDDIIVARAADEVYARLINEGYSDQTMALVDGQGKETGHFKIVNRLSSSPEAFNSMSLALAKSAAQTEVAGVKAEYKKLTQKLADKGMLIDESLAAAQDLTVAVAELPSLIVESDEARRSQVSYQKLCKEEMEKYI
jgi:enolase